MRPLIILYFALLSMFSLQAQDGFKLMYGSSNAYQIHQNANGSNMFEVLENNTFFGKDAGLYNDRTSILGRHNSFYGYLAGKYNSDGHHNTLIGAQSGTGNQNGNYLTLIGNGAGYYNLHGTKNTAVGCFSFYNNVEGSGNTAIGYSTCEFNQGSRNTIIGYEAGKGVNYHEANDNVFIGYQAGYYETDDDKLYIDNTSTSTPLIYGEFNNNELKVNGDLTIDVPTSSFETRAEIKFAHENSVAYTIDYDGSNDKFEIREGNSQILIVHDYNFGIKRTPTTHDLEVNGTASKSSAGDWLANSDARLKKNIKPLNSSLVLSKLLQLQGITYEWDDQREGYDRPIGEQYGFTAQNIQEVFPELVSTDNEGYLETSYGTYDAMYIEAIRALYDKIDALEKRIAAMDKSSEINKLVD